MRYYVVLFSAYLLVKLFYFLSHRNLKQEQIQIRLNLVVAIAIAQITFLAGINATKPKVGQIIAGYHLLIVPYVKFLGHANSHWFWIVQFRIRRGHWIEALKTHLYRVSLDLREIYLQIPVITTPVYNCVYCSILNSNSGTFEPTFVNIFL